MNKTVLILLLACAVCVGVLGQSADDYFNSAQAHYAKSDYDKAIADLTETIKLDPKNAVAYLFRAMAYFEKEDDDKAFTDLIEAMNLDPAIADAVAEMIKKKKK